MGRLAEGSLQERVATHSAAVIRVSTGLCGAFKKEFIKGP
jgi:hypothetical protein